MTDYYALAYIMKIPDDTPPPVYSIGPEGSVILTDASGGLTYSPNLRFNQDVSPHVLGVTGIIKTSQVIFDSSNVRIGVRSGQYNQASNAIAIGAGAGQSGQGAYAIAIGTGAGQSGQAANSIILNATGQPLNNTGVTGSFTVKPVRNQPDISAYASLFYKVDSGEIVYGVNGGTTGPAGPMGVMGVTGYTGYTGPIGPAGIAFSGGPTNSLQYNSGGNGITGTAKLVFDPLTNVLLLNGALNYGNNNIIITNSNTAAPIAIGAGAGQTTQGSNAIAIGAGAGQINQAANSIILNATGQPLNNNGVPGTFTVKPIRTESTNSPNYTGLSYNPASGEVISISVPNQTLTDKFTVAGGTGPTPLAYSYDGLNWLAGQVASDSSGNPFLNTSYPAVGWNGSLWVAGSAGNALAYSSDGIRWSNNSNASSLTTCNALNWNNTAMLWNAGGVGPASSFIKKSVDGITWQDCSTTPLSLTSCNALASNSPGTLTVAGGVGVTNVFATSSNGTTWSNSVNDSTVFTNDVTPASFNSPIQNNSYVVNNAPISAMAMNDAGTLIIIGYSTNNNARTYSYNGSTWGEMQGSPIQATNSVSVSFGWSVAMNGAGNIAAVGAPGYQGRGGVYVYSYSNNIWNPMTYSIGVGVTQMPILVINSSSLGYSTTFDKTNNNNLYIGDPDYQSQGRISRFVLASNVWQQLENLFSTSISNDGKYLTVSNNIRAWAGSGSSFAIFYNGPQPLIITLAYTIRSIDMNKLGTRMIIGTANGSTSIGNLYIYQEISSSNWSPMTGGSITETSTNGLISGVSMNAVGNLAAACVSLAPSSPVTHIYVYNNTTWTKVNTLSWSSSITTALSNSSSVINDFGNVIGFGDAAVTNGYIYTEPVIVTPTIPTVSTRYCNAIARNTIWVAGGGPTLYNPLAWSSDGTNWNASVNGSVTFPFTNAICYAVAWNGSKWVAGGSGSNPLAYSYDGKTWIQSANGGTYLSVCKAVSWNGAYWLALGTGIGNTAAAYSVDGITWAANNNIPTTLFSGNQGLALASRKYF